MTTTTYGLHLTLRIGRIERNDVLDSARAMADFLVALVDRIEMRILAGPLVGREEGLPEKRGCSAIILLYESHAAIHTYPDLKEAFLDVFSCRPFDVAVVEEMLTEFLGGYERIEMKQFPRGEHWGINIGAEMDSWLLTR